MSITMQKFLEDRKKTFEAAVLLDDWEGVKRYCKKYGVDIPKDETILKAAIYKGVQECTDIDDDIKLKAAAKCVALGFRPTMW